MKTIVEQCREHAKTAKFQTEFMTMMLMAGRMEMAEEAMKKALAASQAILDLTDPDRAPPKTTLGEVMAERAATEALKLGSNKRVVDVAHPRGWEVAE